MSNEITRLLTEINQWKDLALIQRKEINRLRMELANGKDVAQNGHPFPCTLGPLCPYCEIDRLREQVELERTLRESTMEQRNRMIYLLEEKCLRLEEQLSGAKFELESRK